MPLTYPSLDRRLANGVRYRLANWPQPGFFKVKLVKRGPWVPCVIWRPCPLILPEPGEPNGPAPEEWCCPTERSRPLRARIGFEEAEVDRVWLWGYRIEAAEYHWRLALTNWAQIAGGPEAQPREAVDLNSRPPLFQPRF